jgi:hypothetical protein
MAFYEFVLQQDNIQNITIHQIKILNYNLHNQLTIVTRSGLEPTIYLTLGESEKITFRVNVFIIERVKI